MKHFIAKQLFDGKTIHHNVQMNIDNGSIVDIQSAKTGITGEYLDGLVSPGFIDIQANGGGGVLFNYDQSPQALETIFEGHAKYGTTSMLPTLITDSAEKMQNAANAVSEAQSINCSGIIGIHFEGPHLSQAKKGIHSKEHVRPISDSELTILTRKDIGKVLVTLAPENVSTDVIADLVNQGVCVSLGHSNADIDTVLKAIDVGARCFTHLYNAMSGLSARNPGLIAAALMDERMYSGLIADLHHVHPYTCALAYKNVGAEKLILVTDSMAHVGSEMTAMPWLDSTITKVGDKLTLDDGSIAGSCLNMNQALINMHALLTQFLPTDSKLESDKNKHLCHVLNMASSTPASLLNLPHLGALRKGYQADFVVLDDGLNLKSSYIKGELVRPKEG